MSVNNTFQLLLLQLLGIELPFVLLSFYFGGIEAVSVTAQAIGQLGQIGDKFARWRTWWCPVGGLASD